MPERADVVAGQLRVTEKPPAKTTVETFGKSLGFELTIFTTPGCVRLQVLEGSGGIVTGLPKTHRVGSPNDTLKISNSGRKIVSVKGLLPE